MFKTLLEILNCDNERLMCRCTCNSFICGSKTNAGLNPLDFRGVILVYLYLNYFMLKYNGCYKNFEGER